MAPVRFGLVGAAYRSQALPADAQTCINLYPEQDESGAGNAPIILLSTPGTKLCVEFKSTSGPAPSFDKAIAGGSTASVCSLGPVAPATANEWGFLTFDGVVLPITGGWAVFGDDFAQLISAPVSAGDSNPAPESWIGAIALFRTKNGLAPTIVNGNDVDQSTPGLHVLSQTITLGAPVTSGSTILVRIKTLVPYDTTVPTITDPAGNIYTLVSSNFVPGVAPQRGTQLYVSENVVGGWTVATAHIANVNGFASAGGQIRVVELSPLGGAPAVPTRGSITITGRTFYVSGGGLFEVLANCTFIGRGSVANDSLPVTMAASPQQLLIASAGTAYVFDLAANTLTTIPGVTFAGPVSQCAICDDFFLVTIKNSKQFVVSAVLNALDWVTNGAAIVSVFPDNIIGMIVSHRQIIFASDTKTVWYYDSGNIFPFDVIPGSDMDQGLAAMSSQALLGDTVLWLGADERGHGKVYKASGYTPQRVSTHAIEFAIQSYSRIDDTVAFTAQFEGHDFYNLYFPTPSIIWTFDLATGMWHQELFNVVATGQFQAAHRWNHTFNFGKHLVGDWASGKVYELHLPVQVGTVWQFADDDGAVIVRERIAPHISKSQQRQFFNELQVLVQSGLGPQPPLLDPAGKPRGPQMTMLTSKDFGNSWDNGRIRDCGLSGEYTKRVRWLRLGEARDLLVRLRMSDPVAWRIVDSYIDYEDGTN
jgi:hypothetical protein